MQRNMLVQNTGHSSRKLNTWKYILFSVCTLLSLVEIYVVLPHFRNDEKSMRFDKRLEPKIKTCWFSGRNTSYGIMNNTLFEVKLKPGLMKLINPTSPKYTPTVNGTYHLENKNFCSEERFLSLIVMILSSTNNFQRRNAVRETWGNSSYYVNFGTVKVLFVLGLTKDSSVQEHIEAEFNRSKDILQGSFIDSYKNLSYKSVLGFKWLTERCRNAKFVLKTDDDVVINMFRIFETDIPKISIDQYQVHCERRTNSPVLRNRNAKAYVEPHQLRGLKYHMPYCHGQYVMFLNDIVPYLYKSAAITPFFWIDDVFNYGIVINNIPALKYKQVQSSEYVSYKKLDKSLCMKESSQLCRYLYVVTDNDNQAKSVWSSINLQYRNTSY
ncbi:beta-1,3-galactosyltransferase 1-like [Ruditapes philippinarum]|uniref:beta-1,3-galactosyltransferase 1-like n=1 Tax=Ruditapes philippinarum TaxID=129788 RepID=UPI00295AD62A|nr:beta-1,3-galactosyltransferase 1-like [Ruditapes philippinarum]